MVQLPATPGLKKQQSISLPAAAQKYSATGETFPVIVENMPVKCSHCGAAFHTIRNCPSIAGATLTGFFEVKHRFLPKWSRLYCVFREGTLSLFKPNGTLVSRMDLTTLTEVRTDYGCCNGRANTFALAMDDGIQLVMAAPDATTRDIWTSVLSPQPERPQSPPSPPAPKCARFPKVTGATAAPILLAQKPLGSTKQLTYWD
eukprot:TRINITY_DN283_c0_g1_i1.p1 TRINITY_DN283_c0_g1~~TRINITY_DN283_c0_g1_i1.p1  ORF type:complete len:217 (+),score=38.40 TRINITY_DN283_c0_g1_i1:48-653(+)